MDGSKRDFSSLVRDVTAHGRSFLRLLGKTVPSDTGACPQSRAPCWALRLQERRTHSKRESLANCAGYEMPCPEALTDLQHEAAAQFPFL